MTVALNIAANDDHLGVAGRHVELVAHVGHGQDTGVLVHANEWFEDLLSVQSLVRHFFSVSHGFVHVLDPNESVAFHWIFLLVNGDVFGDRIRWLEQGHVGMLLADLIGEGSLQHLSHWVLFAFVRSEFGFTRSVIGDIYVGAVFLPVFTGVQLHFDAHVVGAWTDTAQFNVSVSIHEAFFAIDVGDTLLEETFDGSDDHYLAVGVFVA